MILLEPYTYFDKETRRTRNGFRAIRNGNVLTQGTTNKVRTFTSEAIARRFLGRDWPGEAIEVRRRGWRPHQSSVPGIPVYTREPERSREKYCADNFNVIDDYPDNPADYHDS